MKVLPVLTNIRYFFSHTPDVKYIPRALVYIIITLIQLPFHWLEIILLGHAIRKHRLKHSPIFILGHWRSGTTYVQRVLCQNDDVAYLRQYEALLPLGSSMHSLFFKPLMALIFAIFRVKHPTHKVQMKVDFPSEEDIALCSGGFPYTPMWGHIYSKQAQSFFDKYLIYKSGSAEQSKFKTHYQYIVNRTSLLFRGKQLVLKSPANTNRIPELLEMYPEAKFIYLSREAEEVYHSTMNLLKNNKVQWLSEMTESEMQHLFAGVYMKTIERYESTKSLIPEKNLFEISLEDIRKAPHKSFEQLITFLGWQLKPQGKARLRSFIREEHRQTSGCNSKQQIPPKVRESIQVVKSSTLKQSKICVE